MPFKSNQYFIINPLKLIVSLSPLLSLSVYRPLSLIQRKIWEIWSEKDAEREIIIILIPQRTKGAEEIDQWTEYLILHEMEEGRKDADPYLREVIAGIIIINRAFLPVPSIILISIIIVIVSWQRRLQEQEERESRKQRIYRAQHTHPLPLDYPMSFLFSQYLIETAVAVTPAILGRIKSLHMRLISALESNIIICINLTYAPFNHHKDLLMR